jgi:acyl-CoA synthetase (NDP forming)
MQQNPLNLIMSPSSIAIVGASNNFRTMGTLQLLNLINCGFPGEVFPVHPKEKQVLGIKAYESILDLPYPPDMAVLVVPTRLVPEMLDQVGKLGTSRAVIITAGFKETGHDGRELEKHIVDIADSYGIRFLGPNCLGITNTHLPLNITVGPLLDLKGKLSLASQSGTYIAQIVNYLHKNGIVLNKAISVGNEANIDISDCLEYLGEDDTTKAVGLYIEGIRDVSRFLDVARKVSRIKPVIAQYVGGTDAGARSGSSHTGAMAGPDYLYDGLFEQAGIIRAETIEEVYKTGWALATQPPLRGKRIAILTNSGGPGTGIATTCNKLGLDVPEFSESIQKKIRGFLPGHASAKNPVDLTFHIDMDTLAEKIPRVLFESDEIDGVIIHGIMDTGFIKLLYPYVKKIFDVPEHDFVKTGEFFPDQLIQMPDIYNKPLLISSFFGKEDHAVSFFHDNSIPTFDSPEKAAIAMAALYKYFLISSRRYTELTYSPKVNTDARNILRESMSNTVDEYHAKRILQTYGIPVTTEKIVHSFEEASSFALTIGYPVTAKACSSQITHKTEEGMVYLDIHDEKELKEAYHALNGRENSAVLISEMLHGDREFMAGVSSHPGFPPCIMFGLGGIFAEAYNDFSIRMAPLSKQDALEMIDGISARELVGAYRNMTSVDRESLSNILISLSQIAFDFTQIKEIDLNPIIIVEGQPKVADALIIKKDEDHGYQKN